MLEDLTNIIMLFIGLGMAASAILFIIVTIEDVYSREQHEAWLYKLRLRLNLLGRWRRIQEPIMPNRSNNRVLAEENVRLREALANLIERTDIAPVRNTDGAYSAIRRAKQVLETEREL